MKIFAALLIIIFLVFSGYHLTFRSFRMPLFAREFYFTGTEFIFIGLLLGPYLLNLLDAETLGSLEPLTTLLLGWIGLLCGFQFEISGIKKFPSSFLKSSLVEVVITFSFIFGTSYLLLPCFFNVPENMRLVISISLASAASCTSQTGLALLTSDIMTKRSDTINYLRYMSSMGSISALLLFSLVYLFQVPIIANPSWLQLSGYEIWIVVTANAALLLLYNLFLAQRRNKKELGLVIIGMIVLTSGAASTLCFSPLIANFVMGACIVNTTREKERIFSLLISIEKPVYLLLLVFLGAGWAPTSLWYLPMALIFCFVRFAGKLSGGYLASQINKPQNHFPPTIGLGLLEQGGIPLAILFDFQQGFPGQPIASVVAFAIIALIINDMASPHLIDRLLKNKGQSGNANTHEEAK